MCVCLHIAHILAQNSAITVTGTTQAFQKALLLFIYYIFFRFLCWNITWYLRIGFNQSFRGSCVWVCMSTHPNIHTYKCKAKAETTWPIVFSMGCAGKKKSRRPPRLVGVLPMLCFSIGILGYRLRFNPWFTQLAHCTHTEVPNRS